MPHFFKTMAARVFDIDASKLVAIIHETDAKAMGLQPLDRVEIHCTRTRKHTTTVVDTTQTMVKQDQIGLFKDTKNALGARPNEQVRVTPIPQPQSVHFIRNKMRGKKLSPKQIESIISDIAQDKLSDIEISAFLSAVFIRGNSISEMVATTRALANGGQHLRLSKGPVVDKHSIGGINGRTSMVLVPIVAAGGLFIPKTASRAITSAAGTADSMEVLAPVGLSIKQIKRITEKTGGVVAWGGAVDLAPADDKIIKIEHPLALDPEAQVVASVLAKKYSVGAQFVVIDLPVGPRVKISSLKKARQLAKKFVFIGKKLGMKVKVEITDGKQPECNVFGSALEAKNALEILEGKEFGLLGKKSCKLAGHLFEMTKKAPAGKGYKMAIQLLESGQALAKFKQIIKAQGGRVFSSQQIKPAPFSAIVRAKKNGTITELNIKTFSAIARIAGAPADPLAGVILKTIVKEKTNKGTALFQIVSSNKRKLSLALQFAREKNPVLIK